MDDDSIFHQKQILSKNICRCIKKNISPGSEMLIVNRRFFIHDNADKRKTNKVGAAHIAHHLFSTSQFSP